MYVHYYYHVFLLLVERHGVNRLFSKPILVPDLSGGEKLKGAAYIRHIHQPFQYRVELCCLKLFVPAIGCRQLELGHPLWMIVENEVHQLVGEVSENGVQRKQDRLGQDAGLIPCQVLHPNAKIAALCMAEARPSFHKPDCHCAWGLSARPHAAAQFCSHAAIGLVVLALPVARSRQNVIGIRIRGLGA